MIHVTEICTYSFISHNDEALMIFSLIFYLYSSCFPLLLRWQSWNTALFLFFYITAILLFLYGLLPTFNTQVSSILFAVKVNITHFQLNFHFSEGHILPFLNVWNNNKCGRRCVRFKNICGIDFLGISSWVQKEFMSDSDLLYKMNRSSLPFFTGMKHFFDSQLQKHF